MSKQIIMDSHSDLNKKLNVAHINLCTTAEGPFKRMAIWFQGCDILCKGCCNPELQPIKHAHIMTVSEIVNIAIDSRDKYNIEGITFLGGEPTLQINLHILSSELKKNNFGIILFTGKILKQLSTDLVNKVDAVVDGEFQYNNLDADRNLIGSQNQKIHFVSERYVDQLNWFYNYRRKIVEMNLNSQDLFISGDTI